MFYNKTKAEPVQDMANESYWDVTKNRYFKEQKAKSKKQCNKI